MNYVKVKSLYLNKMIQHSGDHYQKEQAETWFELQEFFNSLYSEQLLSLNTIFPFD